MGIIIYIKNSKNMKTAIVMALAATTNA